MDAYSYINGHSSKTDCHIPIGLESTSNAEEELWKLCRICAKTNPLMIPIFEIDGSANNLADIIRIHLPICVSVEDRLPLSVCSDCATNLLTWQELVNTCVKSDNLLKSMLLSQTNNVPDNNSLSEFLKPEAPVQQNDSNNWLNNNITTQPVASNHLCSFCGAAFDLENNLRSHLIDDHTDSVFLCEECNQYVSRSELVPHMSHHAEQEELACVNDDSAEKRSSTESISSINNSPAKPNDVKSPSHSETNYIYKTLDSKIKREMIDNYKKSVVPWVKTSRIKEKICPICGKSFSVASSFHYHMKHYHGGIKEHTCDTCGKKFSMRSALLEHYSIHDGSMQFSCSKCAKRFRSKASLYIHTKNKHNSDKNFICDVCDQSFNWKQKLLRHLLSHTKQRPFTCSVCNRNFSIKYDLTRHMKTHNSLPLFRCDQCDTVYSQWRYLKAHRKRKHPD